ncbi:MAG: hypothetical protein RSA44_03650 [Bacteroides sp.]
MKKPLAKSQIVCLFLLWIALCYIVIVKTERIDGPVILSLLISGGLVIVPLYKVFKKKK